MIKRKKNLRNIAINVPDELLSRIETLSEEKGLTRTQMIIYCMNYYLDQQTSLNNFGNLAELIKDLKLSQSNADHE